MASGAVAAPRETSIKICNTGPQHFGPLSRSYNRDLNVPACPEGSSFVSVEITDHMDDKVTAITHNSEDSIHTPVLITCQEIVRDIFQSEKMGQKGCFIPKGEKPTQGEISQARATRRAYLLKCVHNGDAAYGINARIDDIPGEWKDAAIELHMDREWCKMAPEEKTACPVCGHSLPNPNVAVCGICHAIIDEAKLSKFKFLDDQPAEAKPEPKGKVI
jgi:hypothetical protein